MHGKTARLWRCIGFPLQACKGEGKRPPPFDPPPREGRKPVSETAAAPRRGTEKRQRHRLIVARCDDAEYATALANAARAGMSVGAYMRHLITGTSGPRAVRRPPVDKAELGRALGLIGWYGSNVNQLAFVANSEGELPTAARLEGMAAEIRDMRGALRRALGYGD